MVKYGSSTVTSATAPAALTLVRRSPALGRPGALGAEADDDLACDASHRVLAAVAAEDQRRVYAVEVACRGDGDLLKKCKGN